MEKIIKGSFGSILTIMRVLGLYPPNKHTLFYKVQAYTMYFLFTMLVPSLILLHFVLEEFDISQASNEAAYLTQTATFTIKLLPFIKHGRRIKLCVNYFAAPYFAAQDHHQQMIINNCVWICRRNGLVFLFGVVGALVSWLIKPFFLKGYVLPLNVWLPFDATTGPRNYYSVYLFLTIGISYAAFSMLVDPLVGGLAYHATCQMRVLKNKLERLGDDDNTGKIPRSEVIYGRIKQCIILHNKILDFVKEFETCFSLTVFSQFASTVFAICFCCLQLSMMKLLSFNALSSMMYISMLLGQIFFYCYFGTILFEENNTLTNTIYLSKWYEYDVRSRKALVILMERSKRPMIVTAGKILNLSLETFTMILRRSYSLLAVLKNY